MAAGRFAAQRSVSSSAASGPSQGGCYCGWCRGTDTHSLKYHLAMLRKRGFAGHLPDVAPPTVMRPDPHHKSRASSAQACYLPAAGRPTMAVALFCGSWKETSLDHLPVSRNRRDMVRSDVVTLREMSFPSPDPAVPFPPVLPDGPAPGP